jgi:hypothetical protein
MDRPVGVNCPSPIFLSKIFWNESIVCCQIIVNHAWIKSSSSQLVAVMRVVHIGCKRGHCNFQLHPPGLAVNQREQFHTEVSGEKLLATRGADGDMHALVYRISSSLVRQTGGGRSIIGETTMQNNEIYICASWLWRRWGDVTTKNTVYRYYSYSNHEEQISKIFFSLVIQCYYNIDTVLTSKYYTHRYSTGSDLMIIYGRVIRSIHQSLASCNQSCYRWACVVINRRGEATDRMNDGPS